MPTPLSPYGFGHYNGAPASSDLAPAQDSDLATLTTRYKQFVAFEEEHSKFVNDLFTRYEQNQLVVDKFKHEREVVAAWQSDKQHYEKWIKSVQRTVSDNSFVMLLIDGDGMVFVSDLLRGREEGGRHAAAQLFAAVQNYLENDIDNIPLNSRVICHIYANVRGLADTLVRAGTIAEAEHLEDFVRGFTGGFARGFTCEGLLFDFMDVGAGKDRARQKIIESFKLYSNNLECRQILFGCSHDNGYMRTLKEYAYNTETIDKVVLLEGVPFEKDLASLPYKTKKFPGIFRESKINVWGNSIESLQGVPKHFNMLSGLPTRFPAPVKSTSNSVMDSPLELSRTPSSSTVASDGYTVPRPVISWAAKAAAPAPPNVDVQPKYKSVKRDEGISRNRAGQRIDPPCKDYDKAEVDRVKKLKMCNVHFLRSECPFVNTCTHVHAYNPTMDEIRTLRLVARMAPCQNGSGCQDIRCIYGHRCPAPPSRTNYVKGTKTCIFGEACKFPVELHDIDTNVVKTLVVR